MGTELTCANAAQPWQKKSPSGTAIAGSSSSSQYARSTSTSDRSLAGPVVSHMCLITPEPVISASVCAAPAAIVTDGDTFQPRPSSLAALAPVPVVAPPPAPFSPVGFSGLIERVCASVMTDIVKDMILRLRRSRTYIQVAYADSLPEIATSSAGWSFVVAFGVRDRERDTATPARQPIPPTMVSHRGTWPRMSQDMMMTSAGTA